MFQYLNYNDFTKSRRSLLFLSVGTMIVAGATIVTGSLNVFGLLIEISHKKIVATGQVATAIMLIIFLLQVIPEMIDLFKSYLINRENKREAIESYKLQDEYGLNDGKDYDHGPSGEFEALNDKYSWKRDIISQKIDPAINVFRYLSKGCVDFLMPTIIGFLCVFNPYYLDRFLTSSVFHEADYGIVLPHSAEANVFILNSRRENATGFAYSH